VLPFCTHSYVALRRLDDLSSFESTGSQRRPLRISATNLPCGHYHSQHAPDRFDKGVNRSAYLVEHSAFVFDNLPSRAHNFMAGGSRPWNDSSIMAAHSVESVISERCDSFD
jgi:hypothetical protein